MSTNTSRRELLGRSAALAAAAALSSVTRADEAPKGKLKKAVLLGMTPGKMPIADRFKMVADAGFDGIETYTTEDDKVVAEIQAAADKTKLRIHSVMNQAHWAKPLSSSDPDEVKQSVEGAKLSIKNAKTWGADTILLVPAVVGSRGDKKPKTRYIEAYERSQKVIREELLPYAVESGVTIAIEEVWNKFLLSPLEFAKYVDEFKSPRLGAYFDIGNIVQYGYPEDWILTLGPRIKKFHLKDFKRSNNQFVMLRDGDVNWPDVRKAIDDIGYGGFLTAEYGPGDEEYLKDVAKRIDLIFEGR